MKNCSCSGIQKNMCCCANILGHTCHHDPNDSNIIFVPNKRYFNPSYERKKPSTIRKILQNVYDLCVGYNIRYCAFTGGYSKDKMIKTAFKDWMILLCFLITNAIVFLTLLTRTTYNMSNILLNLFTWTKRTLFSKIKIYLESDSQKEIKDWKHSMVYEKYN